MTPNVTHREENRKANSSIGIGKGVNTLYSAGWFSYWQFLEIEAARDAHIERERTRKSENEKERESQREKKVQLIKCPL